jgi:hypothetical protein
MSRARGENMTLNFYLNDWKENGEAFNRGMSWDDMHFVLNKLNRHFKVKAWLTYNGHRHGGCANRFGRIEIGSSGRNFGTLCHEFGHVLEFKKFGESSHHKRLRKIIARVVAYCQKKSYWSSELEKRTAPKPVKPVPSVDVVRLQKIVKKKESIERFEKKLKYYTRLYSGKISKAKRSVAMLERLSTVSIP